MGDMADYSIESQMWDDEHWGPSDPFLEDDDGPILAHNKVCRYCGLHNLHWHKTDKGWRLFNERGGLHSCEKYDSLKSESALIVELRQLRAKLVASDRVLSSIRMACYRVYKLEGSRREHFAYKQAYHEVYKLLRGEGSEEDRRAGPGDSGEVGPG